MTFTPLILLSLAQTAPPQAQDVYKVREAAEYLKERDGKDAPNIRTSKHFAIKWGNENKLNYKIDEKYIQEVLDYFERVRDLYVNKLGFPMCKSDGKEKFKNNIYITQTGLKPFLEGYAFGFPDPEGYGVFVGEPSIMTPGHPASAHELAHAMDGETGGFRDSDYVGWFWECHAQFMAHQANPEALPEVLDLYIDTSNFDWSSTRHQYGSWIFLQYLMERKGFGIQFINNLWLKPRKFFDEDAVWKTIRLGKLGSPGTGWADLWGDYAKRNVTFNSYARGKGYRESLDRLMRRVPRSRTPLEADPNKPGWYRSPYAIAPQQNAYSIIPLRTTGSKVGVEFEGLVDPARKSAWRNTIVVVNDKGEERFSKTWNQGKESVELKPDEKKVYLVVAATPGVFKHIKFLEDQRNQDRFPYRVKLEGAEPAGIDPEFASVEGKKHPNGGGFVAATATVAPEAYVGPNARVLGQAKVGSHARIDDYAVVDGKATVDGNAVVSEHAYVTDNSKVGGNARILGYTRMLDGSQADENAVAVGYGRMSYRPHVRGNALIKDQANLYGGDISGTTVMMGGADPGGAIKVPKGIYTIFVNQEDIDKAKDNGGLVADYDFKNHHALYLRDPFGANEGFLLGKPKWTSDALSLNGSQGVELPAWYASLPSTAFTMSIKASDLSAGQSLIGFWQDQDNGWQLVPANKDGQLALVVRSKGMAAAELVSSKSLPKDKWVDLWLTFDGVNASLKLDGETVISGKVALETFKPKMAYLGCEQGLKNGFKGSIRKLTISRGLAN